MNLEALYDYTLALFCQLLRPVARYGLLRVAAGCPRDARAAKRHRAGRRNRRQRDGSLGTDATLYISYREKAGNNRDMHVLVQPYGRTDFERQPLSRTLWNIAACPMTGSYLSGSGNSGPVAAWETKGQIFFDKTGPDGQLQPPGEIAATPDGQYPVALSGPDGRNILAA
jgi:hypothetical protein